MQQHDMALLMTSSQCSQVYTDDMQQSHHSGAIISELLKAMSLHVCNLQMLLVLGCHELVQQHCTLAYVSKLTKKASFADEASAWIVRA